MFTAVRGKSREIDESESVPRLLLGAHRAVANRCPRVRRDRDCHKVQPKNMRPAERSHEAILFHIAYIGSIDPSKALRTC